MLLDWILEGVLLGIIGVLGIVGNGTASYVFYKRSSGVVGKMPPPPTTKKMILLKFYLSLFNVYAGCVFHSLMFSLAGCDLLYVVTSLAIFSAPQICPQYTGNNTQW